MSNFTHADMQSRLNEREAAAERFEQHDYLVERFGEALSNFCDVCGWAMVKRNEFGEFYCDMISCEVGYLSWRDDTEEKEEAA